MSDSRVSPEASEAAAAAAAAATGNDSNSNSSDEGSEDSFVIEEAPVGDAEPQQQEQQQLKFPGGRRERQEEPGLSAATGGDSYSVEAEDMGAAVNQDLMNLCRRAFQEFENGSGFLLTRDLGSALRALGQVPTEAQVKQITQKLEQTELYDKGCTKLTFQEFFQAAQEFPTSKADVKNSVLEAFNVLDKDNSGLIEVNRLMSILASLGETLSPADTKELLKELPVDKNGKVDYAKFVEEAVNCDIPGTTAKAGKVSSRGNKGNK